MGDDEGRRVGVGPHPGPWPDDERLDPDLLADGDTRNVIDRYRYWRREAIIADLDARRHAFHVAIENWQHDMNIGTVVRNANAFLADTVHEFIGGKHYEVALMEGGGGKEMAVKEVTEGFFVIGDNRNRARDSRHFGEIPIRDCMGKAVLIIQPGEDSGDIKRSKRWFNGL